jgi:hypothetical protein
LFQTIHALTVSPESSGARRVCGVVDVERYSGVHPIVLSMKLTLTRDNGKCFLGVVYPQMVFFPNIFVGLKK